MRSEENASKGTHWMAGIGGREDSAANISAANPLASGVHESLRNLADKLAE